MVVVLLVVILVLLVVFVVVLCLVGCSVRPEEAGRRPANTSARRKNTQSFEVRQHNSCDTLNTLGETLASGLVGCSQTLCVFYTLKM